MTVTNTLGLDVGDKRVGVALAYADVRVAIPLTTLLRQDADFWANLTDIIAKNEVGRIVLGLPRGLDGQETSQTYATRDFERELAVRIKIPIEWQDEALTSVKAETELAKRGKPYAKTDVDALAASFILTDYLEVNGTRN